MARYTKRDAVKSTERLAKALGMKVCDFDKVKKNCLATDHQTGGYKVVKYLSDGGVSDIFGARRRNAENFWATINFAIDVLGHYKRKRKK